jgi:PAS domain S-box-containing protein
MKKLVAIITTLVLVGALAFLCLQVGKFSDQEHDRFQTDLWLLKHLDTTFKEGVLQARFALLHNYDDFQTQELELTRLVEDLRHPPGFINAVDRTAIEEARAQYAVLSEERKKLFDRFKSKNAILANSRRYLPVALDELAARLRENQVDRELPEMVDAVTRLALMRLSRPDELPEDGPARLQRLKQWALDHPRHPESGFILSVLRHGENIITGNGELDALTRQLLALPTAERIEKLFQAYGTEVAKALRQAQHYRTFLYILGFILLAGVGYTLWLLRAANCSLEQRVEERTEELRSEVVERRQAEQQSLRAKAFLNSVLESLPVGVFMKNAGDRRIILWNKANEDIHGISAGEIVGKNDSDLFSKADADYFFAKDTEVLEQRGIVEIPVETIQTKHRGARMLHTHKLPLLGPDGKPEYLLGISEDITERKRAEAELDNTRNELLDVSRRAGMAEVATGVLHNVGNVLNSVNVSATLMGDRLRKSKTGGFAKVAGLLKEEAGDLPGFFARDARAAQLPGYLEQFAGYLAGEQQALLGEVDNLRKNIEHIKDIVAMQQSYAKVSGLTEMISPAELFEDALRLNANSMDRHAIAVAKDFAELPPLAVDKHKVLQILVNFLRNAKHACDDSGGVDKRITLRLQRRNGCVQFAVTDNGVGIPAENLDRVFNHGFTTRKDGHGFGLHSGANAAREMGGSIAVHSAGPGQGATFTLELPIQTSRGTDV